MRKQQTEKQGKKGMVAKAFWALGWDTGHACGGTTPLPRNWHAGTMKKEGKEAT
jgi:hypothetical protein